MNDYEKTVMFHYVAFLCERSDECTKAAENA